MLTQLSHISMVVRDLDAGLELYGDRLGLPELGRGRDAQGRDVVVLGVGPASLELHGDAAAPAPDPAVRAAVDHFALLVDDIQEAYALLGARGVPFLAEPAATAVGHRNMQRALLAFEDLDGFHVQISQTIDPRPEAAARKAAKRDMASLSDAPGIIRGIDHVSSYCSEYEPARQLYREQLQLEEFFHSTTREAGEPVEPGFAQGAYAVGGTDIELATAGGGLDVRPTTVTGLGFFSDDVESVSGRLRDRGRAPAPSSAPWSARRAEAIAFASPHGLRLEICQPAT